MYLPFIIQYVISCLYDLRNVACTNPACPWVPHVCIFVTKMYLKKCEPPKNKTKNTNNNKQKTNKLTASWHLNRATEHTANWIGCHTGVCPSIISFVGVCDRQASVGQCVSPRRCHQLLVLGPKLFVPLSAKHTKDYTFCQTKTKDYTFCQPNTPKITPSVSQTCQRLQLVSQTHQRLHLLLAKHTKDDNLCWPLRLQFLSAKHAKAYDSCQPNIPKITTSVSQTCQRLQLLSAKHTKGYNLFWPQRLQLLSAKHYSFCQPTITLQHLLSTKHHTITSVNQTLHYFCYQNITLQLQNTL